MEEDTNLNSEDQKETTDETTNDEEGKEVDASTATEESDEDKVPFNKHPRWQEMQSELRETKENSQQLKTELASIKTLLSSKSTDEQKDKAWAKIKELDSDGFTSYEELASRISDVVVERVKSEQAEQQQTIETAKQANIVQMQNDLTKLVGNGLLAADEQNDFIDWCVEKLEETKDAQHPQGNVDDYGNLRFAISLYRSYKNQTAPSVDEKKRLERSKIGASGSGDTQTRKITVDELKNLDWRDIKFPRP